MAPADGTRSMIGQLAVSVLAAVILSAGAAYVSVRVMSVDLDRAKSDLNEVSGLARRQAIEIAQMQAASNATARSNDERWDEIRRRLTAIEADQKEILRGMPASRRDTGRDR